MTETIQCDDDCTVGVAVINGAILLSVVDAVDASTTRLDCTQARQLAAALLRALQVTSAQRLERVQREVQP